MAAESISIFKILKFRVFTIPQVWVCIRQTNSKYYQSVDPMPTKYGGKHNITVLPGVGVGPEIMKSTIEVLKAAKAPLSYEIIDISPDDEDKDFQDMLISIRRNKVALKGNIETKSKNPMVQSRNILLRKLLDLYVYVLPLKSFPGIKTKFDSMDVVLVRQNTEGEYLMLEHELTNKTVESLKILTGFNAERIAEYAYKYAIKYERKHVTVVHTAYVHKLTEGLFIESALNVAKKYPQIVTEVKEVRRLIMEFMHSPKNFDMILATNLNGSVIGNLANGMLGGPALSSGTNMSGIGVAVFEPGIRNKGSNIVNQNIANPTAMILAACDLLTYLCHHKTSDLIKNAVYKNFAYDHLYSRDLGGKATTSEITQNIIRHIRRMLELPPNGKQPTRVKHKRWKTPMPGIKSEKDEF